MAAEAVFACSVRLPDGRARHDGLSELENDDGALWLHAPSGAVAVYAPGAWLSAEVIDDGAKGGEQ